MVTEKRFKALERKVAVLETDKRKSAQEKAPENESMALDILIKSRQIPLYARDIFTHWEDISSDDLEKLKQYLEIVIDFFNLSLPESTL